MCNNTRDGKLGSVKFQAKLGVASCIVAAAVVLDVI